MLERMTDRFLGEPIALLFWCLCATAPIWVAIAFGGFVIGRKKITTQHLFAFMTAEAVALAAAVYFWSRSVLRE
jgi:hypothetical protein